jgi:8-oxo-dGTP diphosphatase
MKKAAVAIILKGNKILLGYSASKDFRYKKWAFVGGGIEESETPYQAAERESGEEASLKVKARNTSGFFVNDNDNVIYVVCDYVEGVPTPNHEFYSLEWVDLNNLPKDTLELNVKILNKLFKK